MPDIKVFVHNPEVTGEHIRKLTKKTKWLTFGIFALAIGLVLEHKINKDRADELRKELKELKKEE